MAVNLNPSDLDASLIADLHVEAEALRQPPERQLLQDDRPLLGPRGGRDRLTGDIHLGEAIHFSDI